MNSPQSTVPDGRHELLAARKTRSGCGIMMVKRPSRLVKPVAPAGEPLGLAGWASVAQPRWSTKRKQMPVSPLLPPSPSVPLSLSSSQPLPPSPSMPPLPASLSPPPLRHPRRPRLTDCGGDGEGAAAVTGTVMATAAVTVTVMAGTAATVTGMVLRRDGDGDRGGGDGDGGV